MLRIIFLLAFLRGLTMAGVSQGQVPPRYQLRDYPPDSLRWLSTQAGVPDTVRVFYLNRLAVAVSTTDLPAAIRHAQAAEALARRISYVRGEMNCLRVLANLLTENGNYVQAQRYYQRGIALAQKQGKVEQLAHLYLSMGATASLTGDNERSLRYLLQSYEQLKSVQSPTVTLEDSALVFGNLGNTYFRLKRYELARTYARRAVALYKESGSTRSDGASKAVQLLVRIEEQQGAPRTPARTDSARVALDRALASNRQHKDLKGEALTLLNLALLAQQQHQYDAMRNAAAQSLVLAQRVGYLPIQAQAAAVLAQALSALGSYREAYGFNELSARLSKIDLGLEKTKALAQLQVRFDVQAREQKIALLTQQAKTAAALAQVQQQRQRGLLGVACLLALGLAGGALLYLRLRRNQAQLAAANKEISASVAEKEVLVQEIHHRVKNNLQLVNSLLGWQSSSLADPALVEVLAGSQARIQSMALVHEFLYQADNVAQVRMDSYLTRLLKSLHESYTSPQKPIKFTAELDAVVMEAKDATAFGLLVNELVTNAYKHAFSQQATGELHISLAKENCPQGFALRVIDNGKGLPATGIQAKPNSLGMHLIKTLTKQLKAKVTASPNLPTGTCIEVLRA